ncbi:MAG: endonuclease domain-containing protein [Sphingomonas sp.]|uniref:endonuclease domain-containing protein n=1 Tax=Sphingomonas sp. TaxID=28214 RepID=UPI003F35F7B8
MQQDPVLLNRAKAMRRTPSPVEQKLWLELRAGRLNGFKFSRQVVIGPYIADVVCRSQKLVIELDGDTHAGNEARDAERTAWLVSKGYRVIRFANRDVQGNLAGVLAAINAVLQDDPSPKPSPQRGEGFE